MLIQVSGILVLSISTSGNMSLALYVIITELCNA